MAPNPHTDHPTSSPHRWGSYEWATVLGLALILARSPAAFFVLVGSGLLLGFILLEPIVSLISWRGVGVLFVIAFGAVGFTQMYYGLREREQKNAIKREERRARRKARQARKAARRR